MHILKSPKQFIEVFSGAGVDPSAAGLVGRVNQFYFNSTDSKLWYWDSTFKLIELGVKEFIELDDTPANWSTASAGDMVIVNPGVNGLEFLTFNISNYLTLSEGIGVKIDPTGVNKEIGLDIGTGNDKKFLRVNAAGNDVEWVNITSVFIYKGTVADLDSLPNTNNEIGHVYNVEEDEINGQPKENFNVVYVGSGNGDIVGHDAWEELGGTIDLAGYATEAYVDEALKYRVTLDLTDDNVYETWASEDCEISDVYRVHPSGGGATLSISVDGTPYTTGTIQEGKKVKFTATTESVWNFEYKKV